MSTKSTVACLRSLADMIEKDPECMVGDMVLTYYPNIEFVSTTDGNQYVKAHSGTGKIEVTWNVSKYGWPMY